MKWMDSLVESPRTKVTLEVSPEPRRMTFIMSSHFCLQRPSHHKAKDDAVPRHPSSHRRHHHHRQVGQCGSNVNGGSGGCRREGGRSGEFCELEKLGALAVVRWMSCWLGDAIDELYRVLLVASSSMSELQKYPCWPASWRPMLALWLAGNFDIFICRVEMPLVASNHSSNCHTVGSNANQYTSHLLRTELRPLSGRTNHVHHRQRHQGVLCLYC
jgi:hypothetical protein